MSQSKPKDDLSSTSAHTLGPWEYQWIGGDSYGIHNTYSKDWADLAVCRFEANARLIAAAPDMLEALRHVEAIMEIVPPRNSTAKYIAGLHMVRAAIRKALGHSGDRPAGSAAAQGQPETK